MSKKEQALRIIDDIASKGNAMYEFTRDPESIPDGYFAEKIGSICSLIDEIGGTAELKDAVDSLSLEDYSGKEWSA